MRIVIAVDGSECSKAALNALDSFVCPVGAEIKVVTALDFSEPLPVVEEVKERETAAAQKLIVDSVKQVQDKHQNAEVTGEILDGYPIESIVRLSRNWLADLIIIGSHGRRGFSRFWLGSVSRAILLHAPCAVRVVRQTNRAGCENGGLNVILGLDQSEHSRHLIDHTLNFPWVDGTRFKCVHVIPSLDKRLLYDEDAELITSLTESLDDLVAQNSVWVNAAAAEINKRFGQDVADGQVLIGDAREKILELASTWPADVVMLGSHGRRGIDKLIMGSVSEAVATNAPCSVEVTRIPAFRKHTMPLLAIA